MDKENKRISTTNHNNNNVRVTNNFSLTFNFGDPINLLAIAGGFFIARKFIKKRMLAKQNKAAH